MFISRTRKFITFIKLLKIILVIKKLLSHLNLRFYIKYLIIIFIMGFIIKTIPTLGMMVAGVEA